MTPHLLAVSIGPVQDFIAAARRTRDLWFGSHLLSEVSKSVARVVQDRGAMLIFPAPVARADLEPGSTLDVANVILAELPDQDPEDIVREARKGAMDCWR